MDFNKVFLAGRLVAKPESKEVNTVNGATTITEYTLAINGKGKGKNKKATYIDCVCWGRTAVFARDWLDKGTNIFVEGEWETSSYKNKDGHTVKVSRCRVNAHNFTQSGKSSDGGSGGQVQDDDFFTKLTAETDDFIKIPDGVEDEALPFN